MNKYFKVFLSLILTVIIVKVFNINLKSFFLSIKLNHIILLSFFFLSSYIFSSLRFMFILNIFNEKIKFSRSFALTIYQNLFNSLSVSGSGEVVKYFKKNNINSFDMGFSIILEKISGIIASISIILLSSLFLFFTLENKKIFFFAIFFIIILLSLLVYLTNIFHRIPYSYYIKKVYYIKSNLRLFFLVLFFSLVLQFISIFLYVLLFKLNYVDNINLFLFAITIPIINLLSAIPLSFSGIGIRDISGIFLLSLLNILPEQSLYVTYNIGIFSILFSVLILLSNQFLKYFIILKKNNPSKNN